MWCTVYCLNGLNLNWRREESEGLSDLLWQSTAFLGQVFQWYHRADSNSCATLGHSAIQRLWRSLQNFQAKGGRSTSTGGMSRCVMMLVGLIEYDIPPQFITGCRFCMNIYQWSQVKVCLSTALGCFWTFCIYIIIYCYTICNKYDIHIIRTYMISYKIY